MDHSDNEIRFTRRTMLNSLLASAAFLNTACWAGTSDAKNASSGKMPRLILIELNGGNDGLNTLVPYAMKRYYESRPVIAVAKDQVLKLNEQVGLHPELEPLMKAWQAGEFHIVQGVGYPQPNLSHFRSIDIWNTASGSDKVLTNGWLADAFANSQFVADGIVVGGDFGPLTGSHRSIVIDDPQRFAKQAAAIKNSKKQRTENEALSHVIDVRQQISTAFGELGEVLASTDYSRRSVKGSELNRQLHFISDLIAHGARTPVLKATQKGFDTHFHQPGRHRTLMKNLAIALAGLRERLIKSGDWQHTLIMTYSEFGRRPAENGSRGTDHGTSAPLFVMGGAVRGGFSGSQPVFPQNKEQNLDFNIDYRQIFRTVAERWLSARPDVAGLGRHELLDFI